jgi:hypothetical protein
LTAVAVTASFDGRGLGVGFRRSSRVAAARAAVLRRAVLDVLRRAVLDVLRRAGLDVLRLDAVLRVVFRAAVFFGCFRRRVAAAAAAFRAALRFPDVFLAVTFFAICPSIPQRMHLRCPPETTHRRLDRSRESRRAS